MNFLAHLYLSGDDPGILVGNFMGDFVKGRVGDEYPIPVRQGIVLHRRIDSFAQNHPLFRRSRQRLAPSNRHYRGVMVDLFYDHYLALEWDDWSNEPLEEWLARVREVIERYITLLPGRLPVILPLIFDELLPSYREIEGIGHALERMSGRIRHPNPLAGGEAELARNYAGLRDDFRQFLPDARRFVRDFLKFHFQEH